MATLSTIDDDTTENTPQRQPQNRRRQTTQKQTPSQAKINQWQKERLERAVLVIGDINSYNESTTRNGDPYVKCVINATDLSGNEMGQITVMAFGEEEIRWLDLNENSHAAALQIAKHNNLWYPAGTFPQEILRSLTTEQQADQPENESFYNNEGSGAGYDQSFQSSTDDFGEPPSFVTETIPGSAYQPSEYSESMNETWNQQDFEQESGNSQISHTQNNSHHSPAHTASSDMWPEPHFQNYNGLENEDISRGDAPEDEEIPF